MNQEELDEILGITRCARCGQRLEGEIECPFCSAFEEPCRRERIPKWLYITACFLTSPLSLYYILQSDRLSGMEKICAFSGCLIWAGLYLYRILQ